MSAPPDLMEIPRRLVRVAVIAAPLTLFGVYLLGLRGGVRIARRAFDDCIGRARRRW